MYKATVLLSSISNFNYTICTLATWQCIKPHTHFWHWYIYIFVHLHLLQCWWYV